MADYAVRAKFKCVAKEATQNTESNEKAGTVQFEAVTGGSPENDSFFDYTPFGNLNMGTVNHKAFAYFEVGKEYYLDFMLAE